MPNAKHEHKELVGLTGEYAVASELCRRGVYAQITLGHHKRTDILIDSENKMLRIEVKTKTGTAWPSVGGVCRADEFLVLVDYKGVAMGARPCFYVLDMKDWRVVVREQKKRHPDMIVDDQYRVSYEKKWKGLYTVEADLIDYLEQWEKIVRACS